MRTLGQSALSLSQKHHVVYLYRGSSSGSISISAAAGFHRGSSRNSIPITAAARTLSHHRYTLYLHRISSKDSYTAGADILPQQQQTVYRYHGSSRHSISIGAAVNIQSISRQEEIFYPYHYSSKALYLSRQQQTLYLCCAAIVPSSPSTAAAGTLSLSRQQ